MIFKFKRINFWSFQHTKHCQYQLTRSKAWNCAAHHWWGQHHRTKWTWMSEKLEPVNYWIPCQVHPMRVTIKRPLGTTPICNFCDASAAVQWFHFKSTLLTTLWQHNQNRKRKKKNMQIKPISYSLFQWKTISS